MRIRKVIHIKGMEYIDLLRELRNCGFKDKGSKKVIDFKLEFINDFSHKYKWTPTDDIVLTIYNSNMLNDVRIKRLLLEYLI